MAIVEELLPVFAVRNAVLFPGQVGPFDVGRGPSLAAVDVAETRSPSLLLVATQKDPRTEEPTQADLHPVACIAQVMNRLPQVTGGARVILAGGARARVLRVSREPGHLAARVVRFESDEPLTIPQRKLVMTLRLRTKRFLRTQTNVAAEAEELLDSIRDPAAVVDCIAANTEAPIDVKIRWLAAPVGERTQLVLEAIEAALRAQA